MTKELKIGDKCPLFRNLDGVACLNCAYMLDLDVRGMTMFFSVVCERADGDWKDTPIDYKKLLKVGDEDIE